MWKNKYIKHLIRLSHHCGWPLTHVSLRLGQKALHQSLEIYFHSLMHSSLEDPPKVWIRLRSELWSGQCDIVIGFFFNDFVVNVLAELADHCLLMFDSKNAKKAKSLPLHHRAWQMVSCVCAKMQCLGFTKHGSAHYVQTSFLFQSLFSGLFRSNSLKLRRAIMVILYRRGFLHFQTSHACSVLFQLHCYEV